MKKRNAASGIVLGTLLAGALCLQAGETKTRETPMKVSTTIDFLDYAFWDMRGEKDVYTLEAYESRIREMAAGGIKKIYLRVNACGVANYPTLVTRRYGTEGRLHWEEDMAGSLRFKKTLDTYDNLAETIRLGHKYGMEVWAWDSLNDDGGTETACPVPEYREAAKKLQFKPLLDPHYLLHPEWQAMRHPACTKTAAEAAEINRRVQGKTVSRIVLRHVKDVVPALAGQKLSAGVKPEALHVYVSNDNCHYRDSGVKVQVKAYRDETGTRACELSGFALKAPYFKLVCGPEAGDFSFQICGSHECRVYADSGELVETTWGGMNETTQAGIEGKGFPFQKFWSCCLDRSSQLVFKLGWGEDVTPGGAQYYGGFTEFLIPDAMAYRLRKFAEIAEYPFDGFMINIRSHSHINLCPGGNPRDYGFNPEVRRATVARCGKDPVLDETAIPVMQQLRGEAVADYFKGCKRLIGNRPLFISGHANSTKDTIYSFAWGSMPWLYRRYFADKSVDGVIMIGGDFRQELTPEVLQGHKVTLGVFREMAFVRNQKEFGEDLKKLREDPAIEEVELYETWELTNNKAYCFDEILKCR